jgi:hypothetical protein
MKRALTTYAAILMLMFWTSAASAATTNFAGTWVLDKSKSDLPGMMANVDSIILVVTQDDKQLKVETKVVAGGQERPSQIFTYNLDGSQTTAETPGPRGGKVTLKAKWLDGGKILELTSTRNVSAQGQEFTITTQDHWELTEGGKVLKIHRTTETPRGTQESKLVFSKKQD